MVLGDFIPPISRTSLDGSSQHRWCSLSSVKVTARALKDLTPSKREQDFLVSCPPETKLPHKAKWPVATGRSPTLQLCPDLGKKISAVLKKGLPSSPPTVRIPACKHFIS